MTVCYTQPNAHAYSETFLRNQVEGLSTRMNVVVVHGGWFPERSASGRLNPWPIWMLHKACKKLLHRPDNPFGRYGLKKLLNRKHVDVLLASYGISGAQLYRFCQQQQLPMVVHFHGFDVTHQDTLRRYAEAYRNMFSTLSACIAVSEQMKRQLVALGARADTVHVIPCGVRLDQFPLRPDGPAEPMFLAVGRFTAKKGPALTLRAFHQVWLSHPEARLVMIGGTEDLFETCERLVADLGISDAVSFPGVQTPGSISRYMHRACALVQHSLTAPDGDQEGAPVSIMEASASGLPVISTRHAGIPEIVLDDQTGWLVPEGDVDGMAQAMKRILEQPELGRKMGRLGHEHIRQHYNFDLQILKLAAVLTAAAKDTSKHP